jgi:hypothetical protein
MSGGAAAGSNQAWLAVVMKNATRWTRLVTRLKKAEKTSIVVCHIQSSDHSNHLRQGLLNAMGVTPLVLPLANFFLFKIPSRYGPQKREKS